ncbi:unnamed protein product, partial [Prorocentrum cordatum]
DAATPEGGSPRHAAGAPPASLREQEARLAAGAERRLRLDAAIRAKIGRVDLELEPARRGLAELEAEAGRWRARVAEQGARTRAAEQALAEQRALLQEAAGAALQRQREGQELRHEVAEAQGAYDRLCEDLQATLSEIAELDRQDSDAKRRWRLGHLARVDARAARRRLADRAEFAIGAEGGDGPPTEEELAFTSRLVPTDLAHGAGTSSETARPPRG